MTVLFSHLFHPSSLVFISLTSPHHTSTTLTCLSTHTHTLNYHLIQIWPSTESLLFLGTVWFSPIQNWNLCPLSSVSACLLSLCLQTGYFQAFLSLMFAEKSQAIQVLPWPKWLGGKGCRVKQTIGALWPLSFHEKLREKLCSLIASQCFKICLIFF